MTKEEVAISLWLVHPIMKDKVNRPSVTTHVELVITIYTTYFSLFWPSYASKNLKKSMAAIILPSSISCI
jgi:hypothetical protein